MAQHGAAYPGAKPRKRRRWITVISGVFAGALALLAMVLPAPYVVEFPAPTINTLGTQDDKPILSINGTQTYPTTGQLDLTAVYLSGGPDFSLSPLVILNSWFTPEDMVVPEMLIYPRKTSRQQIDQNSNAQMTSSQDEARAAALSYLGIDYAKKIVVNKVSDTSDAVGKLQAGDQLRTINGKEITSLSSIQEELAATQGKNVEVSVIREGAPVTATVTPQRNNDKYQLGIVIQTSFDFPFEINFNLDRVGGPSAGMMFSLAIIDQLTPGELTGGKHIAGTGTIDMDGTVGKIGGTKQKMVAAKSAGAGLFLAPAGNCDDVVGNIPSGLTVIKVDTLKQAHDVVEAYGQNKDLSSFPRCS